MLLYMTMFRVAKQTRLKFLVLVGYENFSNELSLGLKQTAKQLSEEE